MILPAIGLNKCACVAVVIQEVCNDHWHVRIPPRTIVATRHGTVTQTGNVFRNERKVPSRNSTGLNKQTLTIDKAEQLE